MRKKITIIIVIAVVALVGFVSLAILRANDLVKLAQPQIEAQLSKALGYRVSVGEIDLSLFPSIELAVRRISLGDETSPSLSALKAKLALLPLLSRKFEASEILLEQPKLTLERSTKGFSVRGLQRVTPEAPSPEESRSPASNTAPARTAADATSEAAVDLHLERLNVRGGSLTIHDQETGGKTQLDGIDLNAEIRLEAGSLTLPKGELRALLPGDKPISLSTGSLTLNQSTDQVTITDTILTTDAGRITMSADLNIKTMRGTIKLSSEPLAIEKLLHYASVTTPALAKVPLSGKLTVAGAEIMLGGPGKLSLKAPIQLQQASFNPTPQLILEGLGGEISLEGSPDALRFAAEKLSLSLNKAPLVTTLEGDFRMGTANTLSLKRFDVQGFNGTATLPLTLTMGSTRDLRTTLNLQGMAIESLLSAFKPEHAGVVTGTLQKCSATLSGSLSPDPVTLRGPGSANVTAVTLKGLNLPRAVLSSIGKGLPFVQQSLEQSVPPEFQGLMNSPDTRIESLDAVFELQGDTIAIRSLTLVAEHFSLTSSGSAAKDGTLDVATTFTFTPEFSQALARRVKDIQKVYDTNGRLVIPLTLQGRLPKLIVLPDLPKLMQTGAGKIIEREAGRAIDKLLKGDPKKAEGVKGLLGDLLKR